MKTTTIFLLCLCCAATGILVWHLKPSSPAPNLYQGTATIEYFNEGEWWGTIYAAIQHRDLPKIQAEFKDSTIQAYPFSVKHESFKIDGIAFGVKVVAVKIDSLRFMGTADVSVTPTGDIITKPITPGMSVSFDPERVNLHKNKVNFWIQGGAQVIPPYKPLLAIGLEWRKVMIGAAWIGDAPGITVGKRW